MTERSTLVERLRAIGSHDWRASFLAHTSDTAQEAATEIERLQDGMKLLNLENGRLKRELKMLSPPDDGTDEREQKR